MAEVTEFWQEVLTVYRTTVKKLKARLAKEGITFLQYSVLLVLARNGPMQMNRFGEYMLVVSSDVAGLVDRMEKKDYVRGRWGTDDRRLYVVEPTELGSSIYRRIFGRFQAYVRRIGNSLSPAELDATVASLEKVLKTVERVPEI